MDKQKSLAKQRAAARARARRAKTNAALKSKRTASLKAQKAKKRAAQLRAKATSLKAKSASLRAKSSSLKSKKSTVLKRKSEPKKTAPLRKREPKKTEPKKTAPLRRSQVKGKSNALNARKKPLAHYKRSKKRNTGVVGTSMLTMHEGLLPTFVYSYTASGTMGAPSLGGNWPGDNVLPIPPRNDVVTIYKDHFKMQDDGLHGCYIYNDDPDRVAGGASALGMFTTTEMGFTIVVDTGDDDHVELHLSGHQYMGLMNNQIDIKVRAMPLVNFPNNNNCLSVMPHHEDVAPASAIDAAWNNEKEKIRLTSGIHYISVQTYNHDNATPDDICYLALSVASNDLEKLPLIFQRMNTNQNY